MHQDVIVFRSRRSVWRAFGTGQLPCASRKQSRKYPLGQSRKGQSFEKHVRRVAFVRFREEMSDIRELIAEARMKSALTQKQVYDFKHH